MRTVWRKEKWGKPSITPQKREQQQLARRISLLEGTIAGVFWQVLPGLEETKKIVAMSVPGRAMQSRNTCADRTRGWPPSTSFSTIVNTFSPSSLNIEKKRVFSTTFSLRWEVIDTCAGKVKNIIISLWYHRPRLYPVQGEEAKSAVNFVRKLTTSKICSLNILTTLGIISLGNQGTIVKTSYRNRLLGSISWMLDGHQLTACWRKRWSFAILN